jgi:hypothetical protein
MSGQRRGLKIFILYFEGCTMKILSRYLLLSGIFSIVTIIMIMGDIIFKHKISVNPLETTILMNALIAFVTHTIVEPISKKMQDGMQHSRAWLKTEMDTINVLHMPFNKYNLQSKTFPAGFSEMGGVGYDLRTKIICNITQRPGRSHKKTKSDSKRNAGKSGSKDNSDGGDSAKPQKDELNDNNEINGYHVIGINPVSHAGDLARLLGVSKKTIQNLQSAKPELLPNASYLPYTKEKLYLAKDIVNYLCGAKKTHATVDATIKSQKKRGRPRISLAHPPSVIAGK